MMKCRITIPPAERYCTEGWRELPQERYEAIVPDSWVTPGFFPDHVAYFCPITGRVWAWMEWDSPDAHGYIVRYVPAEGQAARHRAVVPGSIIPAFNDEPVPDLPFDLLVREFLLYADFFKKGYHRL